MTAPDVRPMTWRQALTAVMVYGLPVLMMAPCTAEAMTCVHSLDPLTGEWYDHERPACNLGRLRPSAKGRTPMCGTRSQVQVKGVQRSAIRRVAVYPVTSNGRADVVTNTYVEGYLPLVVCVPAHWVEIQLVVDCRPDESPVYYHTEVPEWGIVTIEVCKQ